MPEYKIIVTQVVEEVRTVKVNSIEELNLKLEDQGQFIGSCVKPSFTKEFVGRIYDEEGRSMGTFDFDK